MTAPLPQRVVPFYGDELIAVQQTDGAIFVLFARLCENLGIARNTQARRIRTHEVLNEGLTEIAIQTEGGPQKAQCLRLDLLPLWLSGIQAARTKPEVREKLIRYQHEAASVLWQAFKPQIIIEEPSKVLAASTDAELAQLQQIADMGRAIVRMAEEQMELRRRMDAAAHAFQGMRRDITDVQVRLGMIEDKLAPAAYISEAQAAEVSNQVKALAQLLTAQEPKKNHYQGIFGEIYRRFSVTSYKLIRREQYDAVITFLEEWKASVDTNS